MEGEALGTVRSDQAGSESGGKLTTQVNDSETGWAWHLWAGIRELAPGQSLQGRVCGAEKFIVQNIPKGGRGTKGSCLMSIGRSAHYEHDVSL